jgi:hypothetical protein
MASKARQHHNFKRGISRQPLVWAYQNFKLEVTKINFTKGDNLCAFIVEYFKLNLWWPNQILQMLQMKMSNDIKNPTKLYCISILGTKLTTSMCKNQDLFLLGKNSYPGVFLECGFARPSLFFIHNGPWLGTEALDFKNR